MLTLDDIIAIEPRVHDILMDAKENSFRRDELDRLYSRYKRRLSQFVGWLSPYEELRCAQAYEAMIIALCEALDY